MRVDQSKCIGCGACVVSCITGAIELKDNIAYINEESCTNCGVCVGKCAVSAIEGAQKDASEMDITNFHGVWAVCEYENDGTLMGASLEMLSKGRELADKRGCDLTALVIANNISDRDLNAIAETGCDRVLNLQNKFADKYSTELFSQMVIKASAEIKPEVILVPATVNGRELAPTVATKLGTGLTADCTDLDIDGRGSLLQIRPTYGGNIMATIVTETRRPQMATVRPRVMEIKKIGKKPGFHVDVMTPEVKFNGSLIALKELIEKEFPVSDVTKANVIVSGGYGMKDAEGFKLIYKLASKIGGAAGATRKAVDEGWAPAEIQVGQTGSTVNADLYIAFGISGALQHYIGIKSSKKIIAINNDPLAPIFSYCDIAILGDAKEIITELLKIYEK